MPLTGDCITFFDDVLRPPLSLMRLLHGGPEQKPNCDQKSQVDIYQKPHTVPQTLQLFTARSKLRSWLQRLYLLVLNFNVVPVSTGPKPLGNNGLHGNTDNSKISSPLCKTKVVVYKSTQFHLSPTLPSPPHDCDLISDHSMAFPFLHSCVGSEAHP